MKIYIYMMAKTSFYKMCRLLVYYAYLKFMQFCFKSQSSKNLSESFTRCSL